MRSISNFSYTFIHLLFPSFNYGSSFLLSKEGLCLQLDSIYFSFLRDLTTSVTSLSPFLSLPVNWKLSIDISALSYYISKALSWILSLSCYAPPLLFPIRFSVHSTMQLLLMSKLNFMFNFKDSFQSNLFNTSSSPAFCRSIIFLCV